MVVGVNMTAPLGVHTSLLAMTTENLRPQQTPLRPGLTSAHQASHEVTQLWVPLPPQGRDRQARSHVQLKGQCVTDRYRVGSIRRCAFHQWRPLGSNDHL